MLTFNDLLRKAQIDPVKVRLLRHQDASADPGRSPFSLWRNDPAAFIEYQARQSLRAEKLLPDCLLAPVILELVVNEGGVLHGTEAGVKSAVRARNEKATHARDPALHRGHHRRPQVHVGGAGGASPYAVISWRT